MGSYLQQEQNTCQTTNLVHVHGKLNEQCYIDQMLQPHIVPAMAKVNITQHCYRLPSYRTTTLKSYLGPRFEPNRTFMGRVGQMPVTMTPATTDSGTAGSSIAEWMGHHSLGCDLCSDWFEGKEMWFAFSFLVSIHECLHGWPTTTWGYMV